MYNDNYGYELGEKCRRDGCEGIIEEMEDGTSCTCFRVAPCSHCEHSIERMYCPVCDWQGSEVE